MSLSRLRAFPAARTRSTLTLSTLTLVALAALATGCTAVPGSSAPTSGAQTTPPSHDHLDVAADHVDAAWLDEGRAIGVVTWGSSTPTCRPATVEATADGQSITVTLSDPPESSEGCDADLGPRGDLIAVPDGVDVTDDVEVKIAYGPVSGTVPLVGLSAAPGDAEAQGASAGWFGDDGILLLTWGSSSCTPQVNAVEMTDAGAAVTLGTTADMCTMDYAPRVTPILLPEPAAREGAFELTLVGANVDGTVTVTD